MFGCAVDLAAAAQVAAAALGTGGDNLHAPHELEDEPGRWDLNSPTYQHARRQLEQQAEALGEGTARNLVVRGADVLSTGGAAHEVVAATHSYCVLALHHAPLASLACDPLLDGSKVLCPRCSSGECTKFEGYLYDRMRRLPLPRGVLVLLDSQYVCNGCPNGAPAGRWVVGRCLLLVMLAGGYAPAGGSGLEPPGDCDGRRSRRLWPSLTIRRLPARLLPCSAPRVPAYLVYCILFGCLGLHRQS